MNKKDYLKNTVEHIDIKNFDAAPLIESYGKMAFQARNIARAADIYNKMLSDNNCTIILCLAGSLFSAGLKKVVFDMVDNNMADVIVSTGAIMVDQDFFEALGFKHYRGAVNTDDNDLLNNNIDRIYDTFIDEEELRVCDNTVRDIAEDIQPGAYSSREFIIKMGDHLINKDVGKDSVTRKCREKGVPVFVPAFSDSSAGFGLVEHQWKRDGKDTVIIDSVKDFLELTKIKIDASITGLFMIGGGVPKNFAQDTVVAADILEKDVEMHKYAIQITVADERDGGLSGSTLKEAHSWGKVDEGTEQMVFSEATIAFPLIVSACYHNGAWKNRTEKRYNELLGE
ncbi:deoxyhypusine synthase [Elusimicrobiota bacterium]